MTTFTKWLTDALDRTKRQEENLFKKLDDARNTTPRQLSRFCRWYGEELHDLSVQRETLEEALHILTSPGTKATEQTLREWYRARLLSRSKSEPQSTSMGERRQWVFEVGILASIYEKLEELGGRS